MKMAAHLGSGRVQEIQVRAAAAAMERDHGRLEHVVLHARVSVIQELLVSRVRVAGFNLTMNGGSAHVAITH